MPNPWTSVAAGVAHPCLHLRPKSAGVGVSPGVRERGFYPKECLPVSPSSRVSSRQGGGWLDKETGMGIMEA